MKKEEYMRRALHLAGLSEKEGEVPIGAVVVCDGKIVGEGRNKRETEKNALRHAEIEAIDSACNYLGGWRLHNCELYVTLEPCPMCAGAIINARIKKVYFGTEDPKNGAVVSKAKLFDTEFTHKPEYEGNLLKEECSEILTSFFKDLREQKSKENK
ncbi:MAG: nucleoside deaminase [Clostridiales bacterium]|nr:nucleoside deaminase [Clostridiales bacterium]